MRSAHWICGCLLIVAAATSVHAAAFFVDADLGDDSNPGTSAASPFATIQRAIDEAGDVPGPDMIHIACGEYEENLAIDDPDKLTLAGSGASLVTAADPDEHVIEIDGGDVTISNLEVAGGDDGIRADDMVSLTVRNVVVTGNADEGLQAGNVENVKISNSTFSENEGDGVNLEEVDVATINGITLLENDDGIDIEASGEIHVTQLTACGNLDEGFEVDDTASVVIVGGTVSGNYDDGLDLDDTQSVRLVSVVSTGNVGNGLQIEAEEDFDTEVLTVVNGVFSENGEDGIKVVELGAVVHRVGLTNISARENVESGLDIDISGSVKLARVISEDNGEDDILP
ncbi:MAG: right-handed parallel beta-helix repeat-containing protein [Phycisphaerales bacterium]|nr:MAG: right-handed parallel beta-helix repeat-containing protein [Phycisphaerales bacterium]